MLCLALREAVTNIIRHAHATVCQVTLIERDGAIYLTTEDNGLGGPIREGNGLRGMRERVQSIAGTVKLSTSADGGTSLEITLPRKSESPAEPTSPIPGEVGTL